MNESHIATLHKLHEYLSKTGHNLINEVEEIPSLKAFWDTMIDEIPDLLSNLEEILEEAGTIAAETGEEMVEAAELMGETGEIIAEEAGDAMLEASEVL